MENKSKKKRLAKFGENPSEFKCAKQRCKWTGTLSEQYDKKIDDGYFEKVCPKCGNNEFYGIIS